MRIALAHKFIRLTGGADVFFRESERVLRENNHETLMIATGEEADLIGVPNGLLLEAPAYDAPGALAKLRSLPAAIYDREKKKIVKAALQSFQPDVLHVFAMNVHLSPSIVFAAKELGIPVVGTFNDYKHICPNYKLFHHNDICYDCKGKRFYNAVKNNCCKGSRALSIASMVEAYVHESMHVYDHFDHFTFSSDFLANITREFWPHRPVSWSKLRNPFDSRKYTAPDRYDPYGLYFGRLIDEKGVDRLVAAAALVPDFLIKVIGDGPDLAGLKLQAASLGLTNVEFLGPKWGAELDEILQHARFVVVPSIWHENFPYVINQSFAFGRPVIGACRGGITELVDHGTRGLIFDPDNVEELAHAMTTLASDEDLARRMGKTAKTWSDDLFRDEIAYSDIIKAYEVAIRAHHSNRR